MPYFVAGLLAILCLTGCSTMDPDDKAFWYEGWLLPDKGAEKRLMKKY